MNTNLFIPLLLTTLSFSVTANEYQTFSNVYYSDLNLPTGNSNSSAFSLRHYFDKKQALGPLDQFEYINATSNIFGSYSENGNSDFTSIGGEYYFGEVLVGAGYNENNSVNSSDISLGYLVNKDILVKVQSVNSGFGDSYFNYSAQYNHQLTGNDFLGFSVTTDDEFESQYYSSTYFKKLDNQRYFKSNIYYFYGELSSFWSANANYYFNKMTSASISLNEDNSYSFGFNHFFNYNYSIGGSYSHNNSISGDYYISRLNISARF